MTKPIDILGSNNTRSLFQQHDNDYDSGGFDDFGDGEEDSDRKYSNAEKYLDDFENEEREGFKVEVKRPKSGKKKTNFSTKFGDVQNVEDDDIEEDIVTERDKDHETKIETSLGH